MTETNSPGPAFDVIVRGGTVYDGSGGSPYAADIGIVGDRIASIGSPGDATAGTVIDASGLAAGGPSSKKGSTPASFPGALSTGQGRCHRAGSDHVRPGSM